MELYAFYDTIENANCQPKSSKKFHKCRERIPKLCSADVNISKDISKDFKRILFSARMFCFHSRKVVH